MVEFSGATLNGEVDPKLFGFELPKGAEAVKYFMPWPRGSWAKKRRQFKFTGLDGKPITPESLAKKVVVLDFWASWCEPCRESLPYLEQVYQKYKDNAKVAFVAVSVNKPEATDKDLEAVFKKLKVHLPIARDLKRSADALRFATIPTTFLLGADGVVQYFDDRGPDPNVSQGSAGVVGPPAGRKERLPDVVRALRRGAEAVPADDGAFRQRGKPDGRPGERVRHPPGRDRCAASRKASSSPRFGDTRT